MTKFMLYLIRWQLSTPILAPIVAYFKHSSAVFGTREDWLGAAVANLIGGCIFFWVDKFIFKSKIVEQWEIIKRGKCFDCKKTAFVRRLVFAPGGYNKTNDTNPEYRCKSCSEKKLLQLKISKKIQ